MYYSSPSSLILSSSTLGLWMAGLVATETIVIEGGNLYFNPLNVNASVGDVLEFHFLPNNHSVVMGDLTDPCQPAAEGGFYSGFLPVSSGENAEVFQVTINDTNPIVYYCSQNASDHNHCKSGMFGFVNQANQSAIDAYTSGAKDSDVNISPDGDAFGGILAANSNTSASADSNSTSSSGGDNSTSSSTGTASGSGSATSASASASGTGIDSSGADREVAIRAGSAMLVALVMMMMVLVVA